jgi:acetylornithine deacetylase/succinyl-diaminopimelate desuccinylase-like protein
MRRIGRILRRVLLGGLAAVGVAAAAVAAAANAGAVDIPDGDGFSADSVPAYRGDHRAVYDYLAEHSAAHLAELQRWVRQRSISAQNDGVLEMAQLLADDLKALGFDEVTLVPSAGHPGVWGYYDAGAERTLAVYMMYDVQPVNEEDWRSPPFEGAVVDHELGRVLMARAATNQKGPQRAFLNAVAALRAVEGELPVNLMLLAEGEEELGSPNFPDIVARYADRLRTADGVVFPFNSQSPAGDVNVFLGVKGIVYFELEAVGTAAGGPQQAEIHGSYKAITDAPAWRLVQALASLTSRDGNTITVPGYYDAIRPPTEEEIWVFNGTVPGWTAAEAAQREALGVARWIDGIEGRDALARYTFDTTLNIDGIWGGYTDEGVKTILPHKATAKLDSRLVPGQTPDGALALIRAHLDAQGFDDILVRKLSGYPPAQTSIDKPLVQATLGVYRKHGITPGVSVRIAGSAPYYVFTDLGLPLVAAGLGHGSGAHAPNEYMVIEPRAGSGIAGLPQIEAFYVDLLHALAVTPR